ncbi:FAD-dependent oxidoreductase [uncultured Mycolicibacterium sp.]|uniref:FAD-dependent oxidoreductase n=1 Tax=uncultured Mycolicibacterium sp. TaxID=2320817 RepID=UPI002610EC1F|nr:FAD-dependent oxidoreductase [uncultured Mycolicibacterium sp.]
MSPPRGRVAVLGGGMAGLAAAWRLSEPGWQDRFESITVYQRGWRLGGKAASSRGRHARIEEHGLHIWLGSYDNAFALLRECYAELDRPRTDPHCPIRSWDEAMVPADNLAMAERWGEGWLVWPGRFAGNGRLPGEPGGDGRELTVVEFVRRAARLLTDFAESLGEHAGFAPTGTPDPALLRALALLRHTLRAAARVEPDPVALLRDGLLPRAVRAASDVLDTDRRPDHRRFWLLASLLSATIRGLVVDNLVTDPRGFRAINDEEYGQWLLRHGAHPDVLDFSLVRGLYDMVFGYVDGDYRHPAFAAGLGVLLTGIALFGYQGAFFWKMTAGMGDVVIAPLYQALRRRGVRFEFFHRLDALHLHPAGHVVDAVRLGRQARLAPGVDEYDPLIRVKGLPVFPDAPLADRLEPGFEAAGMESHFGPRRDVGTVVLRRGVDFDHLVLAVSLGMVPLVAGELVADRPEWREMTTRVRTVATQAFQLWLRPEESALGWDRPGVTTSGYVAPFDTWASMPQTLWAEDWPEQDRPRTVAYFCGAFDAEWPPEGDPHTYVQRCRQRVFDAAIDYLDHHVGLYLPGAVGPDGFDWRLLAGVDGRRGAEALATQYVSVNIDPSDRYVQSVPGSDRYRLRPDESGYDNLVLAGDWTDTGINAGCIEAAVISGLQAANALAGRGRYHRIRGFWMP